MGIEMKLLAAVAFSLLLAACGGGGGGGSSGTPAPAASAGTAEGLWTGSTSTGYGVSMLVLADSSTWGIYYSGNTIWGAFNGTSTGSGSSFSASDTAFDFSTRTSTTGTITGTVTPRSSLSLGNRSTGGTASLIYNNSYNTAATLAGIAGNYTGWGITKETLAQTVTFAINSSGIISSSVPNCSVSGSVVPSSNGKNYYSITTTFTGSACALGNGVTTTGIATLDASSGVNRLFAITLNAGKTDGFVLNAAASGTAGIVATVNAQAALQNWVKTASSNKFNLYSTNGCLGTFSNSKTTPSAVGSGYQYNATSSLAYSNCTPALTIGSEIGVVDSNYLPTSYTITSGSPANNAYYGVYSGTPNFPVSLTAGASGTVGTQNLYTNSSLSTSAGRRVVTYTSSTDTSSSILLNLTYTTYGANNALTYTEVDTYRVTTAGVATLLGLQVTYASNGVIVYFR